MADEDRIIIETAVDLKGVITGLSEISRQVLKVGTQVETALGTRATNGAKRLEDAQRKAELAAASHAGKVNILTEALKKETEGTVRYSNIQSQLSRAQAAADAQRFRSSRQNQVNRDKEIRQAQQVEAAERRLNLVTADRAQKVTILQRALDKQTQGSIQYLRIQEQIARAEKQSTGGGTFDRMRTFGGFTGGGALQLAGALGVATSVADFVAGAKQMADAGQTINTSIAGNRLALGSLLNDVERGNAVFERASTYGRQYGFTQEQIAEATRGAASIIRQSTADIETILSVQARLQASSPEQSLSDASLAIKELSSGDVQSIVERFEISRKVANEWKEEIKNGADVVDVLDRGLNDLGITQKVIEDRTKGLVGAQNDYNQALEDTQRAFGELKQNSGWTQFLASLLNGTTRAIGGQLPSTENDQLVRASGNFQSYRDLAMQRVEQYRQMGDTNRAYELSIRLLYEDEFATRQAALAKQDLAEANESLTGSTQMAGSAGMYYNNITDLTATATDVWTGRVEELNDEIARQKIVVDEARAALIPYQQAVENAKAANDAAKEGLKDAQETEAEWRNAKITGETALNEKIYDLGKERAQAELDLANFRAPGGGLEDALEPYQDALADATAETDRLTDAVSNQESVVRDAKSAYEDIADDIAIFDQSVESAERNLDKQNDELKKTEAHLKDVNDAYQAQIDMIDEWQGRRLVGDVKDREALQRFDDRANALKSQLVDLELAGVDDDDDRVKRLNEQLDRNRLERERETLRIERENDRVRREAADLASSREQEYTAGEMNQGITSALNESERLQGMLPEAQAAVDAQRQAVADAQTALDVATEAQRLYNIQISEAKTAYEDQKKALDNLNLSLDLQQQKQQDAEKALKEAEATILKPYEDRINSISLALQNAQTTMQLTFADMHHQAEVAAQDWEEFPFPTILENLQKSHEQTALWALKVDATTVALDLASAALDRQKEPVEKEEGRLKLLNTQLDAAKLALEGINEASGELVKDAPTVNKEIENKTTLQTNFATQAERGAAALLAQNQAMRDAQKITPPAWWSTPIQGAGGRGPGNQSPLAGGGQYNVQAVDDILADTGLKGKGSVIVALATSLGIPVELALSMLRQESSFLAPNNNISVSHNNPGNIKYSETTAGYGATQGQAAIDGGYFAKFESLNQGLEAYFKLLKDVYGEFINGGDVNVDGLVSRYAPPNGHNDTAGYIERVKQWMLEYAAQIITGGGTPVGESFARGSVVGDNRDPVLSDQAVDVVLPGGRQSDGYHSDRNLPDYQGQHLGLDIVGEIGSDVKAVRGGRVVFAAPNGHGGTAVIIENDAGEQWYYGHLRGDIDVAAGQDVEAGQVLGQIGDLKHVHLQLKENGVLTDPSDYLTRLAFSGAGPGDGPAFDAQGTRTTGDPAIPALVDPAVLNKSSEAMKFLVRLFQELVATIDPNDPNSVDKWLKRVQQAVLDFTQPSTGTDQYGDTPFTPVIAGAEKVADIIKGTGDFNFSDPKIPMFDAIGNAAASLQERIDNLFDSTTQLGDVMYDTPLINAIGDQFPGEGGDSGFQGAIDGIKFDGGGGGAYGANDPNNPIFGDTDLYNIGGDLARDISDPVGESLIQTTDDTDAMQNLFTRSYWQPTVDEHRDIWNAIEFQIEDPMRKARKYMDDNTALIIAAAKAAKQATDDVEEAAGSLSGPSGGGGNGGGGNGNGGGLYQTNNVTINTRDDRRISRTMSSLGMVQ